MKRFLAFLLCLTALLLLDSCKKEPFLSVSPDSLSFPEGGGSKTVMISANYPWTASASGSGFSVSPSSGEGDATVTVTAAPASSSDVATGSLSIRSEGLSASVKLEQEAKTTITVSGGGSVSVPAEGGSVKVDIQFNTDYDVEVESSAKSWISYSGTKALSSGKLEFSVSANETTEDRTGKVTVKDKTGKAASVTITFTQAGNTMEKKMREALMKLYNALDGPNWKKKNGWGTDAAVSSWEGVSYDPQKGVVDLYFIGVGLKGEIPESINEFINLEVFWISDEPGLIGVLPASFGDLVHLNTLSLSGTSMTSLPDVFAKMTKLQDVRIISNFEMTGPLPESVGNHDEMTAMDFPINHFTGGVPASWSKHYKHLSLSGNYLSGPIPQSFLEGEDIPEKLEGTGLLNQYGSGFDISGIEIPGYWPEGDIEDIITGKSFRFADVVANNKYTVRLNWASWCPFSKSLMPQVLDFYKKYHKDGLEIISTVMWNEDGSSWTDRTGQINETKAKGYDLWYNYYYEPYQSRIRSHYSTTPHAYVYDSKGNTIFSPDGYNDPVRKRFGKSASVDLIPFLESLFGPADDQDNYASSDYSKDGEVVTLQTATVGKGINIVFMGDAYTDRDMGPEGFYESLMEQSMEEFFAIEPYKTFRDRFNVYAVKVVSKNGRTGDGCSTALGSVATYNSIATGDIDKCYEYALKVPGIKDDKNLLIGVLVNSVSERGITAMSESRQSGVAFYGSRGNNREAFGITLRHEAGGHGFAFLDDEYVTVQGEVTREHIDQRNAMYEKYGWYSNVDFTDDRSEVKWSAFLSDDRYKGEVGIYEGGSLYSKGAYRPSENSMMRDNYEYFNAPSRWAIYKRIMELSGEEASFAKFLEYDAVNRGATKAGVRPPLKRPDDWQPGAPPVIVP